MHPKSISDQGINLIKKFEGLAKVDTDGMVVHSAGIAPIDPEYKTDWC